MTGEVLDVVRAAVTAADRGDRERIEALVSDELEFVSTFAASEGRAFRGPTAIADYFTAIGEAFDDVGISFEGVVASEGERALIEVRVRGRGRASGITIDHVYGQIYTVRDGLITRIESHLDPDDAARAFSGG